MPAIQLWLRQPKSHERFIPSSNPCSCVNCLHTSWNLAVPFKPTSIHLKKKLNQVFRSSHRLFALAVIATTLWQPQALSPHVESPSLQVQIREYPSLTVQIRESQSLKDQIRESPSLTVQIRESPSLIVQTRESSISAPTLACTRQDTHSLAPHMSIIALASASVA